MQVLVDREETDLEVIEGALARARSRYLRDQTTVHEFEREASCVLDPGFLDRNRLFLVNTRPPAPELL